MNPNIDFYRILGVLDDAEDIVIKAAYRALAQRYNPDKWQEIPLKLQGVWWASTPRKPAF